MFRVVVFSDECQDGIFGFLQGGGGFVDFFIQVGVGVYVGDKVIYFSEFCFCGMDYQVDFFINDVEVVIGDDGGYFYDDVVFWVEFGYF